MTNGNTVKEKLKKTEQEYSEMIQGLKPQKEPKAPTELTEQQRAAVETVTAEHPDQPWKQGIEYANTMSEESVNLAFQAYFEEQEQQDELTTDKKQRLTLANLEELLRRIGITVRNNVLIQRREVRGMPKEYSQEEASENLPVYLKDKLGRVHVSCTTQGIRELLGLIADKNRYNPFTEALEAKEWSGTDRLKEVYAILGIDDDELSKTFVRKWLWQAIALAYNDDGTVKTDGVLVLQGAQAAGKTTFFSVIAGREEWFTEGVTIDTDNKDTIIMAISTLITELGELDSTLKKEQSALKSFITKSRDDVRRPYAHEPIHPPRRTSLCATVNPEHFLKDETGSRRFWVIHVEKIDKDKLHYLKDNGLAAEWSLDLFRQIKKQYYDDNKKGFYLTAGELEALEKRNSNHQKQLDGESQVYQTLDFNMPERSWKWFKPKEVLKLTELDKKISDVQMGRILKRIAASDDRIETKVSHKYNVYKLPLHGETH